LTFDQHPQCQPVATTIVKFQYQIGIFSLRSAAISRLKETRFPAGIFDFHWNRTKTTFNANATSWVKEKAASQVVTYRSAHLPA